ncbi:uncharacterized protein N7459_006761 [Penicillium hispanicum]|uniref:uncharacterized protein n=1 Tax=Penicillium hispanicum TaxID=1080232 RepID=UPI0025418C2E|nr:uncharacterized protein N7459_006761 [Penicillium hispanicum]KAJ5577797.1 hypothetical protein N7459_006761 [Penicillium hispanicum]
MESPGGSLDHVASQPIATEEPQQTQSPEPIELIVDSEVPLVARLTQALEDCDWNELQEKYASAMDEHSRVEDELRKETTKLLEIFTSWSQTTVLQDEKRALKRFKTQMQHVQNSEANMENKKKHCEALETTICHDVGTDHLHGKDMEVVKAFQSALALLNEQLHI